jgi:FkbM family methyltransferase
MSSADPASKTLHYAFVEIGTADFDTLIETCPDSHVGLSIDPLQCYLDRLPHKPHVRKVCAAVSDKDGESHVYFVPFDRLQELKLPAWTRGCNSMGAPHPTVVRTLLDRGLDPEAVIHKSPVAVVSFPTLVRTYGIQSIQFLKIDTEGHDCTILDSYMHALSAGLLPAVPRIQFESNSLTPRSAVEATLLRLAAFGYVVVASGDKTTVELKGSGCAALGPPVIIEEYMARGGLGVQWSRIPRLVHMIWVSNGSGEVVAPGLPATVLTHLQAWRELMPDFTVRLWTDADIALTGPCDPVFAAHELRARIHACAKGAQRADIMRYQIAKCLGGIYVDADMKPCRSMAPLLQLPHDLILAHDLPITWDYISIGFFACAPGHPVMDAALSICMTTDLESAALHLTTGPRAFGKAVARFMQQVSASASASAIAVLHTEYFYKNEAGQFLHGQTRVDDNPMRFASHLYWRSW